MTTKIITGLYDTYDDAAQTVRDLAASDIPDADISVVANNVDNGYVLGEESSAAPDAEAGAVVGSVLVAVPAFSPGLAYLPFPASDRS